MRHIIVTGILGLVICCLGACHKNDPVCYQCNAPLVHIYLIKGADTVKVDAIILYTAVPNDSLLQQGYTQIMDTLYNTRIAYTDCFDPALNNDIMKSASNYFNTYCTKK